MNNTTLDKIKSCKTPEELIQLKSEFKNINIGFSFIENRAYVRVDLRQELLRFCETNSISLYQISKVIGYDYNNLQHFVKGRRGLPLEKIEEIIAIMRLPVAKL